MMKYVNKETLKVLGFSLLSGLVVSTTVINTAVADNDKDKHCNATKNLPSGLYSGSITFANGNIEPLIYDLHADGSWTMVSRLEYPSFAPGISDLESAFVGQWKSNCDGTYRLSGIAMRQAGDGGGFPGLFGYTSAEIPSLPNYQLVNSGDFRVSESGKMTFLYFGLAIGDANFALPNGVLLPLSSVLPILSGEFQRQSVDGIYEAIPK